MSFSCSVSLNEFTDFGASSDEISGAAAELPGMEECVENSCVIEKEG